MVRVVVEQALQQSNDQNGARRLSFLVDTRLMQFPKRANRQGMVEFALILAWSL